MAATVLEALKSITAYPVPLRTLVDAEYRTAIGAALAYIKERKERE